MAQPRADLESFFHPNGTAIIGRIDGAATVTADELHNRYDRFGTRWYLVNPRGGTVAGDIPVYSSVADIPDAVELAVVNVAPPIVPGIIDEIGAKGIKYALVFTSGFSEVGAEGAAIERDLGERAKRWGIRVFGPNTNTNAFEPMPHATGRDGKIGLLTQSGHNGRPSGTRIRVRRRVLAMGAHGQRGRSRIGRLPRVLRVRRRDAGDRRLRRGLQVGRAVAQGAPSSQRQRQARGDAEDRRNRSRFPHGELAHRPPHGFRRGGQRSVRTTRCHSGGRSRRIARHGGAVLEVPVRRRPERLHVLDLGWVGHVDDGASREARHLVARVDPRDAKGAARDHPLLSDGVQPGRQRRHARAVDPTGEASRDTRPHRRRPQRRRPRRGPHRSARPDDRRPGQRCVEVVAHRADPDDRHLELVQDRRAGVQRSRGLGRAHLSLVSQLLRRTARVLRLSGPARDLANPARTLGVGQRCRGRCACRGRHTRRRPRPHRVVRIRCAAGRRNGRHLCRRCGGSSEVIRLSGRDEDCVGRLSAQERCRSRQGGSARRRLGSFDVHRVHRSGGRRSTPRRASTACSYSRWPPTASR